jgi:quinol monooxygenase YgiN
MIVVTGRVQIPEELREQFLAIATEMCSASRGDDGCIGYRFYADLEQPERYVFIEEWRDDEALQSHFMQPHTARSGAGAGRGRLARPEPPATAGFARPARLRSLGMIG